MPVNLFLTEDGVLKLGYYGLKTQAECFPVKGMVWDGLLFFSPEVFSREYKKKSGVWSFGISLIEMMGMTPYYGCDDYGLPPINGYLRLPFDERSIKSSELIDFLEKCFERVSFRWSVKELMTVSVMG